MANPSTPEREADELEIEFEPEIEYEPVNHRVPSKYDDEEREPDDHDVDEVEVEDLVLDDLAAMEGPDA